MQTSISVIIPTHERPETCALAVESALRQTRVPLEVIVCCDGCSPEALRALSKLEGPVRVLDLPKALGYGYGNRNTAMAKARGEVVNWLADDDLYLPDHLERVGEVFDAGGVDLVQATCCHVRPDGFIDGMGWDWNVPFIRERFLAGEVLSPPMGGVAHRVATGQAAGGWNADMERQGDVEFWRRLIQAGTTAIVAAPTVLHMRATGRVQTWADRIEQNRALLARMEDPHELARLRAEMAHAIHRRLADHQQEGHHLKLEVEALRRQRDAATAEVDELRATLERTYSGGWWRLRARILPLLRARAALARRTGRGRG
jgi:GT2 family glycosyltransferase